MKTSSIALVLAAASLMACSASSDETKPEVEVVRSSLARDTAPVLTPAQLDTFSEDQADFAVELYQAVQRSHANEDVFLSPHSISTALAMTFAGARAETRDEMKKTLHYGLDDGNLHRAFDYLDLALASRGQGAVAKDGKPFRLAVTNSIWGQKGLAFAAPFLDTIAVNYGAGLNVVDFKSPGANENARLSINGWVEEKTESRIKDLVPKGAIDDLTRLVLVNAVYFNAAWSSKFCDGCTAPAPFTKLDGSTVQVPTMQASAELGYAKGDGFEAVELPYDGNETSMLVIAPTTGTFATFESSLTGGKVLGVLAGLQRKYVDLRFPKVKLDASLSLRDPLRSLGMKHAFGGLEAKADFTGITTEVDLEIKDVLHKTFLDIDENGTEAAAATAVIVGEPTSVAADPVTMKVDRPFLVAIVDRQTKTLVFFGRVLLPKS